MSFSRQAFRLILGLFFLLAVPASASAAPSGTISATPITCTIAAGASNCSSSISWSTSDTPSASVYVGSQNFAGGASGSQNAPWITPNGSPYTFTLKDSGGNTLSSVQVNGVCASGSTWNGGTCASSGGGSDNSGGGTTGTTGSPDLTVGLVTPTAATAGSPISFTATVSNIGTGGTGAGFKSFFQVHFISLIDSTDLINEPAQEVSALSAGGTATVSFSYNPVPGTAATQYIRLCADKSGQNDLGTITETNENNNCGYWTPITVTQTSTGGGSVANTQSCHLSATKNSDGSYKLSWTFTGGSDYLINISSAGTFYSAGSTTVNPTGTVTYTGDIQKAVDFSPAPIYGTCSVTVTGSGSGGGSGGGTPPSGGSPDLTAGSISPTVALANAVTIFSSIVSNVGGGSTGTGSVTTFQKAIDSSGTNAVKIGSANIPTLAASGTSNASVSYTFGSPGTYYVRACADQGTSSVGNTGGGGAGDLSSSCANLAKIGTGTAGKYWTRRTQPTTVTYGATGGTVSNIDPTDYTSIWSYKYGNPGNVVPWPGNSGSQVQIALGNTEYLSEKFTVPANYTGTTVSWPSTGGSGISSNFAETVSKCPGDFGQTGSVITTGCSVSLGRSYNGVRAVVSDTQQNASCTLKPGDTYYLNILPMADLPSGGVSVPKFTTDNMPWMAVDASVKTSVTGSAGGSGSSTSFNAVPAQCTGTGAVANLGLAWQKSTIRNWLPASPSESISDATDYRNIFSFDLTSLVPWPSASSGSKPTVSIKKDSYLALGFTVPSDVALATNPFYENVGSLSQPVGFTISECPGDFGQAGTHINSQYCKCDRTGGCGGLVVSSGAAGTCPLTVGKTYFLNLVDSQLPAPGSTVAPASACTSSSCTAQIEITRAGGTLSSIGAALGSLAQALIQGAKRMISSVLLAIDSAPTCHLSATKQSDGSFKLSYTLNNDAANDYILNISSVGTFYNSGSTTVNPSGTVTYTGTINKAVDFSPPQIYGTCSVTVTGSGSSSGSGSGSGSGSSSSGAIVESNEQNNCGPWTPVIVSGSGSGGSGTGGGGGTGGTADLTAGAITPSAAGTNITTKFSASILNNGTGSTGNTFSDIFQVAQSQTPADDEVLTFYPTNPSTSSLSSGGSETDSFFYTFTTAGNYYMRACADMRSAGDMTGNVSESNKNNNCGPWTPISVIDGYSGDGGGNLGGGTPSQVSCTNLAQIGTGTSGKYWTQLTMPTTVFYGGFAVSTQNTDPTDYNTVWSYPAVNGSPAAPVTWPGSGGATRMVQTHGPYEYISQKFTVPENYTGPSAEYSQVGSGGWSGFTLAVSQCPGDFGQTGTVTTLGCTADVRAMAGGYLTVYASNTQQGSRCTVKPGGTYYLNILPEANLPQNDVSVSRSNAANLPWIAMFWGQPASTVGGSSSGLSDTCIEGSKSGDLGALGYTRQCSGAIINPQYNGQKYKPQWDNTYAGLLDARQLNADGATGPWPKAYIGWPVQITLNANQYASFKFNSGSTGYSGWAGIQIATNNSFGGTAMWSVSTVPGDFFSGTALCAGGDISISINPAASANCKLKPNTDYYLNVSWASFSAPHATACDPSFGTIYKNGACITGITPYFYSSMTAGSGT